MTPGTEDGDLCLTANGGRGLLCVQAAKVAEVPDLTAQARKVSAQEPGATLVIGELRDREGRGRKPETSAYSCPHARQECLPTDQRSQPFWHGGWVLWKTVFPQTVIVRCGAGDGFKCITFIVCFYFCYLLYQLHLISSIRSWGLLP